MTYEEVIKHFGSGYRVSMDCDFGMGTPCGWKKRGFVPIHAQMKLEQLTGGVLKASLEHCKRVELENEGEKV